MRFVFCALLPFGLKGQAQQPSPNACVGVTSQWFDDFVYCGIAATESLDVTGMENCFFGLHGGSIPSLGNNLNTYFKGPAVNACTSCVTTFTNSVYALKSSFVTSCGFSGTPLSPIWDAYSSANIRSVGCLALLDSAITTMNACMTSGGTVDIVTGAGNQRCRAIGDYNTYVDAVYHPWYQLIVQAVEAVEQKAKGSMFDTDPFLTGIVGALTSIAPCNSCLNGLYSSLFAQATAFTADCANPYSSGCAENVDVAAALASFVACTGGDHIDTAPPATDCSDVPDGAWYAQLVAIGLAADSAYTNSTLVANIEKKQGPTSLTVHLRNSDFCTPPMVDFANAVYALKNRIGADCNSATSSSCLVWLYDAINTVNANFAMVIAPDNLDIVTGLPNYRCTNEEWTDDLTYAYRSMVPMYIAAKYADSFAEAITAMPDNADLANLEENIYGIGCAQAFAAFVSDANTLYTENQVAMDAACADPYSNGCVAALSGPLDDFTVSSGQVLNWSATSTTCTIAQFEALIKANVADNVLAATTSTSVASLVTVLNEIYSTIGSNNLEAPCWLCFIELARAVYNLGNADLATCVSDITGAACDAIIGDYLNGFENCSGFAFALAPTAGIAAVATLTLSTTVGPRTTSSATTTSSASTTTSSASTTSTVPITTSPSTKTSNSVVSFGLAVLAIITLEF